MKFVKNSFLFFLIFFLISGCSRPEIKIGLLASFSGFDGEMGKDALNGVQIAVDRCNASGGIKGRKIELVIYDDKGTPAGAEEGAEQLVEANVKVIIGPFLSALANPALKVCEEKDILLFSPTVASTEYKGKDDMLFQLNVTADITSSEYAERIIKKHKFLRAAIIIDSGNLKYSGSWRSGFVYHFNELGGIICLDINFNGYSNPGLFDISKEIILSQPEAVIIVANAFYTASLAQQLRKLNSSIPLFASEWAPISMYELLSLGGSAVEGMEMYNLIDLESQVQEFLDFKNEFSERFNRTPGHAGLLSYEATEIIIKSFRSQIRGESLKKAIIKGSPYHGILWDISFDEFGNSVIPVVFSVIRSGKYKRVP